MRKLLLLLNLIALGAISQVTPVGGFLPINSSKSYTAGNATCSNVIARGTLSVGSTATVNSSAFMNEDIRLTQSVAFDASKSGRIYHSSSQGLSFQGRTGSLTDMAFFTPSGTGLFKNPTGTTNMHLAESGSLSVGANTTPSACLHVFGNAKVSSTFSLGSANLTGGNTGTVAVLSDAVFPVNLISSSSSPADGSTLYIGSSGYIMATSAVSGTVSLPFNCTLIGWQFNSVNTVANGTSETSTISIMSNGTESLVLSSTINFSLASGYNNFSGSGLSTNFSAGDKVNLKIVNPTWATNPAGIVSNVIFWFVRRS